MKNLGASEFLLEVPDDRSAIVSDSHEFLIVGTGHESHARELLRVGLLVWESHLDVGWLWELNLEQRELCRRFPDGDRTLQRFVGPCNVNWITLFAAQVFRGKGSMFLNSS